jgi:hypothetical protein
MVIQTTTALPRCPRKNNSVSQEIAFIARVFSNPDAYKWESPIAHLITREFDFETYQDACLYGGGGFSVPLRFWWSLAWPEKIVKRTSLKSRKSLSVHHSSPVTCATFPLTFGIRSHHYRPSRIDCDTGSNASRLSPRLFAHLLMFTDTGIEADHIS